MATSSSRPKTGSVPTRSGFLDQSLPPEYTFKVMKKISQLTKVIYQLNVRNEEHDNFVHHLKSLHEREMKNLHLKSEERIKMIEAKHLGEVETLQEHVACCNGQIALLENDKAAMKIDADEIKHNHQSEMVSLKEENLQRVKDLSIRLAVLKKDLTDSRGKVVTLEQWYQGSLQETIKKVKNQCNIEREAFLRERSEHREGMNHLKEHHQMELERMREQYCADLHEQLREANQSSDVILARAMQERKEKEKSLMDASAEEVCELNDKISSLSSSLREAEDRYTMAEQRLRDLELVQEQGKSDVTSLESQLQAANLSRGALQGQISDLKMALEIEQEKYQQQSLELTAMSALVARLEAACADDSLKIKDLKGTVDKLQHDLRGLETERDMLLSTHKDSSKEHQSAIRSLSEQLKKVQKEKEDLSVQYAREIEAAQARLSTKEQELGSQHIQALQDLRQQLESLKAEHKDELESLREKMMAIKNEEIGILKSSHNEQMKCVEGQLNEAQGNLLDKEEELSNLKKILRDSKEGLGTASTQISRLEEEVGRAKKDLRRAKSELGCRETECQSLKVDVASLQAKLESVTRNCEEQLVFQKEQITKKLEEMWLNRIKEECSSLRNELSERHQKDSRAAVTELIQRKEEELRVANDKWRQEVEILNKKILELEGKLAAAERRASLDMQAQQVESREEIERLQQSLQEECSAYEVKLRKLQGKHNMELEQLRQGNAASLKELEDRLVCVHSEEIRNARLADKIATDALKVQLKREHKMSLEDASQKHREAIELLKEELNSSHEKDVERVRSESKELVEQTRKALSSELEQRELELVRQSSAIDSLNSRLKDEQLSKENHYREIVELKRGVNDLRRELERKGDEVLAVRRESNTQLRQREQQLVAAHQVELDSLSAQNQKQLKGFLDDFNTAKDMLNAEIQSLNEQLKNAEAKYAHRKSRPEDLETIRELKKIISQQEFRLKEVISEKKLYEMELVNREQNYNKVFSANPMVGVLDPLVLKDKKKVSRDTGMSGSRHASAPTLATSKSISNDQTGTVSMTDSPLLHHRRTAATKSTVFPI